MTEAARALMLTAASGRDQTVPASLANHATPFGPGAIVLGVVAFELFLNQLIVGSIGKTDIEIQDALERRTLGKVDFLQGTFGTACTRRADLELAIEVRNEIIHHFPRPGQSAQNLPPWYLTLERLGLFVSTGDLAQKLASYKLAYWVNRVVAETVADLLRGSSHPVALMNPFKTSNFHYLLHDVPVL